AQREDFPRETGRLGRRAPRAGVGGAGGMTVLVTGGGGFLGGAVVRLLRARGDAVRSFTRSNYPWLAEIGAEQSLGDLADAAAVTKAADGCEAVVHVEAKAGVWGRYEDYVATNVT